jgi:SanA protein
MYLIRLTMFLAFLFILACAGLLGYQLWQEYSIPAPRASQAMIVLGAQVNPDGEPSKQLLLRLEAALKEYQTAPKTIVVCGAKGIDEPATEASVMRNWLVNKGVNPAHVLLDEGSFNTRENIRGAQSLLPAGTKEVLIITSDYHLPRAMAVARDLGLNPSGIGSPILPEFWIKNHARETLAWGKYFLNKWLPFIPTE